MKVLVTGGAGFIGSAVCRRLVGVLGLSVLNVDKLTYAADLRALAAIADSRHYHFAQADICNASAMSDLLEFYQPDAVLHLAAESHVDRSISSAAPFVDTNIVGTFTLLECVRLYLRSAPTVKRQAFRFVHVSTDEVFGSLGSSGYFTETTPYAPRSPYSASKAASDHLVNAWLHTYGLPAIVSNCSNNYGPYQFPEKLIPLMSIKALRREKLPVYGLGLNVRDWLHVDDHAAALTLILERGVVGEKYIVGGFNERANIDVVQTICDTIDNLRPIEGELSRRGLIHFVEDRPGHDVRYAVDASKIRDQLGWTPSRTFDAGLAETVEWYLANEAWWSPLLERSYGGQRLGLVTETVSR